MAAISAGPLRNFFPDVEWSKADGRRIQSINQSIKSIREMQRHRELPGSTYVVSRECGKGVLKRGVIGVGTFVKTGLQLHGQLNSGVGEGGADVLMC